MVYDMDAQPKQWREVKAMDSFDSLIATGGSHHRFVLSAHLKEPEGGHMRDWFFVKSYRWN